MKVIAVVGVSGVGKSTLLAEVFSESHFLHLEASQLIRSEMDKSAQTPEDLRLGPVISNQEYLIGGFKRATAGYEGLVVLDGHSVIDTPHGLVKIPAKVFAEMGVSQIIVIQETPSLIYERRRKDMKRRRPSRSIDELAQYQRVSVSWASEIGRQISCPVSLIEKPEVDELVELFLLN
jgi:adenylate kinase